MSTKTIPARTITNCDRCGVECTVSNRREEGVIAIKQHALDYYGAAVASANRKYDLCDRCMHAVTNAIDAALSAEQKGGSDHA